ncbi:MAG: RNA methyltransferase [Candidatus Omnitrophota bacterium]|jgi:TrmH family RNA methyltransferase
MKISSLSNPHIKNLLTLRKPRARFEQELTIVDGVQEITRVLEAGVPLKEAFFGLNLESRALMDALAARHVPVYEVADHVMERIAFGARNEGIVAVCAPRSWTLEAIPIHSPALYVVVEQVEKPGNLGAIIRTCDAAGVDGVMACDPRTDIYNPNCIRASLGCVFTLPVVKASSEEAQRFFKSRGIKIIATTPSAEKVHYDADLTSDIAVIVGSEHEGLGPFWLEHADETVRIPMHGQGDSLNVSVSSAVVIYEACRQRRSADQPRDRRKAL